jgi:hypothetical protein
MYAHLEKDISTCEAKDAHLFKQMYVHFQRRPALLPVLLSYWLRHCRVVQLFVIAPPSPPSISTNGNGGREVIDDLINQRSNTPPLFVIFEWGRKGGGVVTPLQLLPY